MKPKPVWPLHKSILGAQKNCKLPLIAKQLGPGPQPLPFGCRLEPSRAQAASSKICLVRAEQSPGICFTGGNPESFPPKQHICSFWASTKRRSQESPPTAKSRAHGGGMHVVHPVPRSTLPTLGNWSSPMVAASVSNHIHPRDGWNFPWFTAIGERAQQSQNAARRIRISAWAFVSSAQQKGHCPCSTD